MPPPPARCGPGHAEQVSAPGPSAAWCPAGRASPRGARTWGPGDVGRGRAGRGAARPESLFSNFARRRGPATWRARSGPRAPAGRHFGKVCGAGRGRGGRRGAAQLRGGAAARRPRAPLRTGARPAAEFGGERVRERERPFVCGEGAPRACGLGPGAGPGATSVPRSAGTGGGFGASSAVVAAAPRASKGSRAAPPAPAAGGGVGIGFPALLPPLPPTPRGRRSCFFASRVASRYLPSPLRAPKSSRDTPEVFQLS